MPSLASFAFHKILYKSEKSKLKCNMKHIQRQKCTLTFQVLFCALRFHFENLLIENFMLYINKVARGNLLKYFSTPPLKKFCSIPKAPLNIPNAIVNSLLFHYAHSSSLFPLYRAMWEAKIHEMINAKN